MTSLSTIGQIGLTVSQLDTAVPFYRDALGLKHLFSAPPAMAFFAAGSQRILLSQAEKSDPSRYNSILYFQVAEIQSAHADLLERGVRFERDPHLVAKMPDHELWMAFFRDPDGNLLALMSEKRP